MSELPHFSVLTVVRDPRLEDLSAAIESVRAQTFRDWELILVNDGLPSLAVGALLAEAAAGDARIMVIEPAANVGMAASSNDALGAARGQFLALLDHDDVLVPHALERVHAVLAESPEADYVYSDEDKIDAEGELYDEFRKPDWSPERLRGQMYTCHLSVLRASLVREVGGFRAGYDGSQDHDLVLRVTERARRVVHVPEVLYHWRVVPGSVAGDPDAQQRAWVAGCRAVQDQLDRLGIAGTASYGRVPGTYRIERVADPGTSVSVIIPTRGGSGLVWGERRCFVLEAVASVLARHELASAADRGRVRPGHAARRTRAATPPRGGPPRPRALRRAVQFQRQVQRRLHRLNRRRRRTAQRRHPGHHRRASSSSWLHLWLSPASG